MLTRILVLLFAFIFVSPGYGISLHSALAARRSVRNFLPAKSLSDQQLVRLLWAGQGITNLQGFRTAPSAGALYPLELYVVCANSVQHYLARQAKLQVLFKGDLREQLAQAALGQKAVQHAPCSIVIAGDYSKMMHKYNTRGVQYAYIEAGAVMENILLQAVALSLAAVPIGAFHDKTVSKILQLPRSQVPLMIIPLGYPQ